MTPLDRYRDYRDDPYRGYAPGRGRRTWFVAVGLPVAIVLVLVANIALAVTHPRGSQPKSLGRVSGLGYQSLLIPSDASIPQFQIDGSQRKSNRHAAAAVQQRVVMSAGLPAASGQAPASAGRSAAAGAARHRHASSSHGHRSYRTDANGYRIAPARDAAMVPATTWVAHLEHGTKGYPSANAFQSNRKVPGSWYGYPSVLPVIDATRDRLHVRLAQRPDEATSWIKRSAVVMGRIHYAIVVDISQHWLYVFYKGVEIESFPVGTGKAGTPTPTGNYFVAFHAPPNGPGYGSVMLETSAHSQVIAHFEGGDDAIIAIHGPVGSDGQIGDHGAAISNGCIRMHDADLNQVKHVHNGSPVILTY